LSADFNFIIKIGTDNCGQKRIQEGNCGQKRIQEGIFEVILHKDFVILIRET